MARGNGFGKSWDNMLGHGPAWLQRNPEADDDTDCQPCPVLALYGLPSDLAEPVVLLAEILGWQVIMREDGAVVPARLCLAMLPATPGQAAPAYFPPLVAWSPDNNLNELISRQSLSILDQPACIDRLEQLLQQLAPSSRLTVRVCSGGQQIARLTGC